MMRSVLTPMEPVLPKRTTGRGKLFSHSDERKFCDIADHAFPGAKKGDANFPGIGVSAAVRAETFSVSLPLRTGMQ